MEIWKDITGYEGLYMVSNKGRVKSLTTGKIKAFFDNGRGYLNVNLYKNNIGKTVYIHRLVGQAFIPNPLNKPQINHKDKNKANNCVENLEWCTQSENDKHKWAFGDLVYSEEHREKLSKRMKGPDNPSIKNPKYGSKSNSARKVVCNGIVFGCIKECAECFNTNYSCMRKWVASGIIPAYFPYKDLRYYT